MDLSLNSSSYDAELPKALAYYENQETYINWKWKKKKMGCFHPFNVGRCYEQRPLPGSPPGNPSRRRYPSRQQH
ncbi:hypothetical protein JYU34_011628 [Plutella xylostella]|uniref:Uncharacterized protein n=1 Tax=Plutella xylostella TaxID=51655 RepID=A0ABQ7QE31_PLUXY|nr:hypothetical protein JYU34_011628 [Plutella xylostella]